MVFASGWLGIPEQFTTIALLFGVFMCLMPAYALSSTAAALVGNQVGCLRVKAAKFYYYSCLIIMWFVSVGICVAVMAYKHVMEERLTDDDKLHE